MPVDRRGSSTHRRLSAPAPSPTTATVAARVLAVVLSSCSLLPSAPAALRRTAVLSASLLCGAVLLGS